MEGFSANNVWRMRAFYLACREFRSLPQPVAEKAAQPAQEIPSPILAQPVQELPPPEFTMIPWYHNVLLVQRVKDPASRLWYARMTAEHGWSRNILALQIDSAAHTRHGKAVTNFKSLSTKALRPGNPNHEDSYLPRPGHFSAFTS
jgi:hypothetical protein